MRPRPCHTLLGLLLAAGAFGSLPGCRVWQVQPGVPPDTLVEERRPEQVRMGLASGETIVLTRPWVADDSIVGTWKGDTAGVAVADVTSVAVRRLDAVRTAGFAVIASGVTFALLCALACEHGASSY